MGKYYSEYDKETELWYVFHTDKFNGRALSSWLSKEAAEQDIVERNKNL